MTETWNQGDVDERLARVATDADRLNTLRLLSGRSQGAQEVAEALGLSLESTVDRLEAMCAEGLVETVESRAGEPLYRALVRTIWDPEAWDELSIEERRRLAAWILRMIKSDVKQAFEAGTLGVRADEHVSRTVSVVDQQGWRDLIRIQNEAIEAGFAVQAESAERLAESGEESMSVLSAVLCFELPPRPES